MSVKRLFITLCFLFTLLWGASKLKEATNQLQFEVFNKSVITKVVELPICGRSNIITVKYKEKKYNVSVNKNDCIQGKYKIGDTVKSIYNSKLDEMNPENFVGVYRLYMAFLVLIGVILLIFLFNGSLKSIKL